MVKWGCKKITHMSNEEKNKNGKKKKLSMRNDYVFKRIFTKKGNEVFLKEFLSNLLEIEIKKIKVEHDIALEKELKEEKLGILDVKAVLNNNIEIDIELQMEDEHNMVERSTYYGTRLLSSQLESGQNYLKIRPSIVISIMNFNLLKYEEYINSTITVFEKHREDEANKYLKYYYIELPKFRKSKVDVNDKIVQWLYFIDSVNKKRIGEVMEKNKNIRKANEELEYLSGNAAERRKAELREKYKKDITSAREHGIDIGEQKGIEKRNIEIVKSMLKEKIDISIISKVTNLSIEEIEKINI